MQSTVGDMPMQMGFSGLIMFLIMAALIILPFWFIFSKAGHSKWLSLLMVVPLVNFIMLYFLAFSTWPDRRDT
jgi:hypothetical protein